MKKYLSNIYTTMFIATLASLTSTAHAHSGHYHNVGDLHSHAINEIILVAIVLLVGVYFLIKR